MAIVTSIFMLVMVVMMGVSYYQMQQVSPLQSEVMQTLKELNEANGENEALQQQFCERRSAEGRTFHPTRYGWCARREP